jgi:SagB-type dehydrogenase family enzyme
VDVLSEGLEAVPESQVQPPQDLKTLSSWLFMADGLSAKFDTAAPQLARTCPSSGALYPFEIYIAAFAIDGLEPGLYHYNIRDFSLCKLRDGAVTLATIKRGRPDLNFLKGVPGAILVSTNFWRSAWRYRQRGYRMALLDTGHMVQNLVAAANGLGIATMPRLQMNDKTMRELIGIDPDVKFGNAECVQAMVVWATPAKNPLIESPAIGQRAELPAIERAPLSQTFVPYGSIVATHEDCVAPGVALREIRSPLTELSPVPLDSLSAAPNYTEKPQGGPSMRQVLMTRRSTRAFAERSISRDQFLAINRMAFRGGSVFPMMPDGPHAALVRPYWIAHIVAGMDSGIYYYDPATDGLISLSRGNFHSKSAWLCVEQKICGQASALCFLMSDLRTLTAGAGPDAYRLAHIEAGLVGQRMYLAAHALGLGCVGIGAFYDEEVKGFLSLTGTGWDPIYALAIGAPAQR